MKKINKILVTLGLFFFIWALADLSLAQGKGYFFERGNELFIPDNLIINGYLAVEDELSSRTGLIGDVLVKYNFNLDSKSKVYFCKDIKEANKNCSEKILIWQPDPSNSLDVIEPSLFQLQAKKILADQTLNIQAGTCSDCEISTNSPVKVTGCLANNVTQSCTGNNTVVTGKMYLDFLGSLSSKTRDIIETIAFTPSNSLTFIELNLGKAEDVEFQNNLTIGGLNKKPQQDLNNICWSVGLTDSCSPANGAIVDQGTWSITSPTSWTYNVTDDTISVSGIPTFEIGSAKLCCYLNITYPVVI